MEITQLGNSRAQITIVHDPALTDVRPRVIDHTRWVLLHPDLLDPLRQHLAKGHRAANVSSDTWKTIIHRPYLLEAYPVSTFGPTTVYPFGRINNRVNLIRTQGQPLQIARVGLSSLILLDHDALLWLKALIMASPRNSLHRRQFLQSYGISIGTPALNLLFQQHPRPVQPSPPCPAR